MINAGRAYAMMKDSKIRMASLSIIVLMIIFLNVGQATDANKPTTWAETEIAAAVENHLVPEELQGNYQKDITRGQYVLLALKVFELTGKDVGLTDEQPFSDVSAHHYEKEIIKAFNAGIVKGDGKGNYHPDNLITREEIASLIYNLLKQITPDKDFTVKDYHQFADNSDISDWAMEYINFCFENNILTGYGGNKMAPKDHATIEQSIALLYRIANKENLLAKGVPAPLKLSDNSQTSETPPAEIVDQFVKNYGLDTYNVLANLSQNENIKIMNLREASTALLVSKFNSINMDFVGDEKSLFGMVYDTTDELFTSVFRQLIETFKDPESIVAYFDDKASQMKSNKEIDIYELVNDNCLVMIETKQDEDAQKIYFVTFIQR